jgi:hypothetical protein
MFKSGNIYEIIIFPLFLYGHETWSLTLREEYRLKMFESRMLRRIFGYKRDKVTGVWRKLLNEEFHILCSSTYIIRMIIKEVEVGGGGVGVMLLPWERREIHTEF